MLSVRYMTNNYSFFSDFSMSVDLDIDASSGFNCIVIKFAELLILEVMRSCSSSVIPYYYDNEMIYSNLRAQPPSYKPALNTSPQLNS